MNSIHDLGGMHGMGPLPLEDNEPVWHADWERGAFGVNILLLMAGVYNADESRHAMEKIPALHWLESPYYEHWVDGVERILKEKGIATEEELRTGKSVAPLPTNMQGIAAVEVDNIEPTCTTNHPVTGPTTTEPKFKEGDRVRAININPRTHTRLPRYIRGHVGTVVRYGGPLLYADARAHGAAADTAVHSYSVRFEGNELWGPDSGPKDAVYIDLYETYIERA